MTKNRRERGPAPVNTPTQEDEADILSEIGAVPADDGSEMLVASEAKILEAGAVDTESIRENRRVDAVVDKQRGNVKGVQINVEDVIEKYDIVLRTWPANTLTISVKRRTGSPAQWMVDSRPKTGSDLYVALRSLHGPNEEATYDIRFLDSSSQIRGIGRITMPDARPAAPPPTQGQPLMIHQQPPPPAQDPMAMMQGMFQLFQQMQASVHQPPQSPQAPPQQPAIQATPPTSDPTAVMRQMFQLYQQMQGTAQPPQTMLPLPAASSTTDPMAMMQSMFQLFQQMQGSVQPPQPPQQPSAQPAQPPAQDPMAMMQGMFRLFQQMQASQLEAIVQAQAQVARPAPGPFRGPYRGPQSPPYDQQGAPQQYGGPQQQPPQAPRSAAQEFRDAVTLVRSAVDAATTIQSIIPGSQQSQPSVAEREEEGDNPVRVMDVGDYKLVVDKQTGAARKWETGVANLGTIMKWVGEQREAIQKASGERKPAPQQLPPGYVEVGPGYVPPPGYVAIPVDPSQVPQMQAPQAPTQALPQPPAQMPPPITAGDPAQRRTWGAPKIPGEGNN